MPVKNTEVVIVGGGVTGCSAAYRLALAGARVTLVEQREIASGASGASAGGVRQQNRDPRELSLAMYAIRMWAELEAELDADLEYYQQGNLNLVEREEDLPGLRQRVERERAAGLDVCIVRQPELSQVAPALSPHLVAGAYCPGDGHANPIATTKAFARAAQRHGALILTHTQVTGVSVEGGRVRGIETSEGALACDWLINAAGAWSAALARLVDVDLPVGVRAPQMIATAPTAHALDQVLGCVGRSLSLKQVRGGSYIIGGGWPSDADLKRGVALPRHEGIAGSARTASDIVPALRQVSAIRVWAGLEGQSTDGVPVIGPLPGLEGYLVAAGFSGHGFALAPATGLCLTNMALGRPLPCDISWLHYGRFQAGGAPQAAPLDATTPG